MSFENKILYLLHYFSEVSVTHACENACSQRKSLFSTLTNDLVVFLTDILLYFQHSRL